MNLLFIYFGAIYLLFGVWVVGFINSRYNLQLTPSEDHLWLLVAIMIITFPIGVVGAIVYELWANGNSLGKR